MRASRSLQKLHDTLEYRVRRLEKIFDAMMAAKTVDDRRVSYIIVEVQTLWANFSRHYYLSCSTLKPVGKGGNTIQPSGGSLASERDALLYAIQSLRDKHAHKRALEGSRIMPRDEPTWHEKATILKLSASLKLSNDARIINAFSYPTSFFRDAVTVRNFYAHRNRDTADKVKGLAMRQYGGVVVSSATELVASQLPGRAEPLASEWLRDVRSISGDLCA